MIYLDHAATTPVAREVADTMYDVLLNGSGNPSSQYPYGAAAKKRLEADRAVIAAALGCKPDELYFTSCGTESDNWAIRLAAHQNRRVGKHIITTAVEHSAVLEPCRQLEQEGKVYATDRIQSHHLDCQDVQDESLNLTRSLLEPLSL